MPSACGRPESKARRVHAVALSSRSLEVIEQVTKMSPAGATGVRDAVIALWFDPVNDAIGIDRFPEARPAGAAVELLLAIEEGLVANHTVVDAIVTELVYVVAERSFGSSELGHPILLERQPVEQFHLGETGSRTHAQ